MCIQPSPAIYIAKLPHLYHSMIRQFRTDPLIFQKKKFKIYLKHFLKNKDLKFFLITSDFFLLFNTEKNEHKLLQRQKKFVIEKKKFC